MNVPRPITTLLIGLFIISIISCKNDVATSSVSDKESIFFEDYKSPAQKWGYLNKSGIMIIDNIYDDVRDFKNGMAQANLKGRWGFIDNEGNILIPFEYKEVSNFVNGHSIVRNFNDQTLIVDRIGNQILKADSAEHYIKLKENYIIFKNSEGIGLKDLEGHNIIAAKYEKMNFVSKSLLSAKIGEGYLLINLEDKQVSKQFYQKIFPISDGLIKFRHHKKIGFLNSSGQETIEAKYDHASHFYKNRAAVCVDGSCYLIDHNDKRHSSSYDYLDYGGEGLWMYAEQNKYGFLDANGAFVAGSNYDILGRYKEGYASYSKSDLWGYLNKNGQEVLAPSFSIIWDFNEGLARYIGKTGVGFIDTTFQVVIAPKYFETRDFHEGLARVQTW